MKIFGRWNALAWVIITIVVVFAPIVIHYSGIWSLPTWLIVSYDGLVMVVTGLFAAFVIWGIYGDH